MQQTASGICLTRVETLLTSSEKFDCVVLWDVQPKNYDGKVRLVLFQDGKELRKETTESSGVFKIKDIPLEKESIYEVQAFIDGDPGIYSSLIRVMTWTCQNIQGRWDGETLSFCWDSAGSDILRGHILLSDGKTEQSLTFGQFETEAALSRKDLLLSADTLCTAVWHLSYDDISCLTDKSSAPVSFILSELSATRLLTLSEETLTAEIVTPLSAPPLVKAWLYWGETELAVITPETTETTPEGAATRLSLSCPIPSEIRTPEQMESCSILFGIGTLQVEGRPKDRQKRIPLAILRPAHITTHQKTAELTWTHDPSHPPLYYEATLGEETLRTCGHSLHLSRNNGSFHNLSVDIAPVYLHGRGLPAKNVPLFSPGYYMVKKDGQLLLGLRTSPQEETPPVLLFSGKMFQEDLKNSIKSGGFSLEQKTTAPSAPVEYVLTTADGAKPSDYLDLLAILCDRGISPQGLYRIMDACGRALPSDAESLHTYACALDSSSGSASLIPGHILELESETYRLPLERDKPYMDGHIPAGASRHPLYSHEKEGSYLLCFDPFLMRMLDYMTVPDMEMQEGSRIQNGAGGLIDALSKDFLNAYCRIKMPGTFLKSDSPGDSNYTAQPFLVSGSSCREVLRSCGVRLTPAAAEEVRDEIQEGEPLVSRLYMRGRTSLSILLRLSLNGKPVTLPLGSSLWNLMERYSIPSSAPVSLYRSPGEACPLSDGKPVLSPGKYLPVHLDWEDNPDYRNIVLLPGDRVEVPAE